MAVVLDKLRDHLEEVPVVPGGPDNQDRDLGVCPAVAVVLDKVRHHLEKVPTVPGWRPECRHSWVSGIRPLTFGTGLNCLFFLRYCCANLPC